MSQLLSNIQSPDDIKHFSIDQLQQLATEMREEIIDLVATKEGHLGASLGVVELTIALHKIFDAPKDAIVWDVGHQAYGHKLLTGRREQFHTNRQKGGISGFPKISESVYDVFGVGHSSTSISAALGMALAAKLQGDNESDFVAVIGDASIVSGMAFEALNHAGATDANLLIILNDNDIGIDASVGALKKNFALHRQNHQQKKDIPSLAKMFNFSYTFLEKGHDLEQLTTVLSQLRQQKGLRFLHVVTTKGKGLKSAEDNQVLYHAPGKFDKQTGDIIIKTSEFAKYQQVFGQTMVEMARTNPAIYAITPAMPTGSSLVDMMKEFPKRAIDVGIAEQHAVTLSAGLALRGMKAYCCIYSTFLQRAYDQIVHDIALQNIPVVFCIDRAGLVGEDGSTHQGVFDISYLNALPNMTIWAPKDASDLRKALFASQYYNESPIAIRYPRGECNENQWKNIPNENYDFPPYQWISSGEKILIISTGTIFQEVEKAKQIINGSIAHLHINQIKPFNERKLKEIFSPFQTIVTVEEGVLIGGMGHSLSKISPEKKWIHLGVPDIFIEHATVLEQLEECKLDAKSIAIEIERYL